MVDLKPTQLNNETAVKMNAVNKWYGEFHVLRDINLVVRRGERIVISVLPVRANRR